MKKFLITVAIVFLCISLLGVWGGLGKLQEWFDGIKQEETEIGTEGETEVQQTWKLLVDYSKISFDNSDMYPSGDDGRWLYDAVFQNGSGTYKLVLEPDDSGYVAIDARLVGRDYESGGSDEMTPFVVEQKKTNEPVELIVEADDISRYYFSEGEGPYSLTAGNVYLYKLDPEVSIKSFWVISDGSAQVSFASYEKGMTWQDFIDSEYNTEFSISGDSVFYDGNLLYYAEASESERVNVSDPITVLAVFVWY